MKRCATHRPRLTVEQLERARRLALVHPMVTVAEIMGTAPSTIRAARDRRWQPTPGRLRALPNDWGIIAPGRKIAWLAAHYGASHTTITRWRREKPVAHHQAAPWNAWRPPEDFAEVSQGRSPTQLGRHYGVHRQTIQAAQRRLGIHPDQIAARGRPGWAERFGAEQHHPHL